MKLCRHGSRAWFAGSVLVAIVGCKTSQNSSRVREAGLADDPPPAAETSTTPTPTEVVPEARFGERYFGGSKEAEEGVMAELLALSDSTVEKLQREDTQNHIARRSAHSKPHGCVLAKFKLDPDRPVSTKFGLFKEDGEYNSWIRFSNAFPTMASDLRPDGRGFAIKVIDNNEPRKVPGQKMMPGHENSNAFDFPFVSGPVFPVSDIKEYAALEHNANQYLLLHPDAFFRAGLIGSQVMTSPLNGIYWSMGAYRLGEKAVKLSVRPSRSCPGSESGPMRTAGEIYRNFAHNIGTLGADYLRQSMIDRLSPPGGSGTAACFDFGVQFQGDDATDMPVEDPTVEWSEQSSLLDWVPLAGRLLFHRSQTIKPFVKVASIEIEPQEFTGNDDFCERLSFNPWRNVEENRPLGNLMRARRVVYAQSLAKRMELNGKKPVSDDLLGIPADVLRNSQPVD